MNWRDFEPKPSIHEQRRKAQRDSQRLAKQGRSLSPVVVEGRKIAGSFWGRAWCENLESYRDYENRLPRGRSYVRHGAVLDLKIEAGKIVALVSGSEVYQVEVDITRLSVPYWRRIQARCAGQVGSLIELLQGRLSEAVMRIMTHPEEGLFPKPAEIRMTCSCPDVATMCKHVAAVLYAVGTRLDARPDLLFVLRQVDHAELIAGASELEVARPISRRRTIEADQLSDVFGIDIAQAAAAPAARKKKRRR